MDENKNNEIMKMAGIKKNTFQQDKIINNGKIGEINISNFKERGVYESLNVLAKCFL